MRLVVDASCVVEACLAADATPLDAHELHAPALLASEVTSVLRHLEHRGDIPAGRGQEPLEYLLGLAIAYEPAGTVSLEAYEVAVRLGWAKTYDAEYVALARRLRCPLVTIDAALARRVSPLVDVREPADL